jgi:voltage-gated potassium channel
MVFVRQAYAAIVLIMLTLVIQTAGIAALIQWAKAHLATRTSRPGRRHSAVLMVRLMSLIICLHMLEILLWASFYRWKCFSTWESAFYFSVTSYSTVGNEELILKQAWRQMGPIESLTGVLMCALSASFLFAVVTRMVERDEQLEVTKER